MKFRTKIQIFSTLLVNGYWKGLFKGTIYQGPLKGICFSGLNCYSCPLAWNSCPLGALQNFFAQLRYSLSGAQYHFGLYVLGFLGGIGTVVGRMQCGWLCPFGSLQDLLAKIPVPKVNLPPAADYLKYFFLLTFVFLFPLLLVDSTGFGQTWFCRLICPAGTLEAGLPLVSLNEGLRKMVGLLFAWKWSLLLLFLGGMLVARRFFCRVACPLGAFYGPFNKISMYRLEVDKQKCTRCEKCYLSCPMLVKPYLKPNEENCIRCLDCLKVCPNQALSYGIKNNDSLPVVSLPVESSIKL